MAAEVHQGDCLEVIRQIVSESVDLVYADPPFFTQKTHSLTTRDRTTRFHFSDEWNSRAQYIEFLRSRLKEFRRVLKLSGSLFFHCDTNASHYIRCLLDETFGEIMFRSEIIWHYRRWSNSQRSPLASHQTIFFYSKSDDYQYHQLFEDYSASTNVDQILQRRQRDAHGKVVYARDSGGNIVQDGHKNGVPIADVWDIPFLNPKANERVGYPTQKPILLLERIISLVTSRDDLVLDPFCGSGTALIAAELLGRNSVGIDRLTEAVELTKQRLAEPIKTSSELLRKGRQGYIQSDAEALAHLQGAPFVAVQRNQGIDAILNVQPGENPVLIRVQRSSETLLDAAERLHKAGQNKQPAALVLIVTQSGGPSELLSLLPADVIRENSAAVELKERLSYLRELPPSARTDPG
jgi:site-specific DNA-methyltransferase (adenine-specific)